MRSSLLSTGRSSGQLLVRLNRAPLLILLLAAQPAWGQPEADADEPEGVEQEWKAERLELMQEHMQAFTVRSDIEGFPEKFEATPIFRYDDPARGYVDAAVWRLGEEGRPKAIVTTELHPRFFNRPRIVFEYLSLTEEAYSVGPWSPAASALEFRPITGAPVPADNERARGLQLGRLAARFAANEIAEGQPTELRLLPKPVHRYRPAGEGTDGGMFFFAYGTNPEAALFLETDGDGWSYAVGRLSGAAQMIVTLDGETAWEVGAAAYQWSQPYTASNTAASIPGIAADGSPLQP
jgi:hypothetical protein